MDDRLKKLEEDSVRSAAAAEGIDHDASLAAGRVVPLTTSLPDESELPTVLKRPAKQLHDLNVMAATANQVNVGKFPQREISLPRDSPNGLEGYAQAAMLQLTRLHLDEWRGIIAVLVEADRKELVEGLAAMARGEGPRDS